MKTIVQLVEEQKEYFLEKDTAAKQAVEANIAPVETDPSSASRAYVVGEQLFLNDVLYDVTSPISVGDAIAVGTNITAANKLSADIKSKIDDLYSKNQTLTSAFVNNVNENGCKNRFVLTFEQLITASQGIVGGTWNGNTFTHNGVTYTCNINDAGIVESITVNGTATARSVFRLSDNRYDNVAKKYYKLFSENRYMVTGAKTVPRIVIDLNNGASWVRTQIITEDSEITIDLTGGDSIMAYIEVTNGQTVDNVTIYPMLCLKSDYDIDSTYEPYSKTNRQLTEDSVTWTDYAKSGAVNVIPFDLAKAKAANTLGTWSGNTYTVNNVTFAFNDDGTLVVNTSGATARTTFQYYEAVADVWLEKNRAYKASAFNDIVKDATQGFFIQLFRSGKPYPRIAMFNEQTFVVDNQYFGISNTLSVQIVVENGTVVTNQTIKPIISDAAYNGPYVPYAKTNHQLTQDSVTWDDLSEVGAVNYLVYPYYNTTKEDGGLTYTNNGDGTINISAGTTTANSGFWFEHYSTNVMKLDSLIGKTVKFSVDMSSPYTGLNASNARIELRVKGSSSTLISENVALNQSHNEFVFTVPSDAVHLEAMVWIGSGKTLPATKMSPMLAPVSYNGPYVPYAKTNKELTKVVTNQLGNATLAGTYLSDCNDVASSGTLNLYGASTSTANSPYTTGVETSANSFVILSRVDTNTNWGMQLAIPMTSTKGIYMRFKASGTWGTWSKITP